MALLAGLDHVTFVLDFSQLRSNNETLFVQAFT